MKIKVNTLLILLLTWAFGLAQAQKKTETTPKTDEDLLKEYATAFVEAYSKFTKTKDKQSVLKFMSGKVSAMLVNSNLQGTLHPFTSNYEGFVEYLDKLLAAEDMHLEYKLTKIARVAIVGEVGTVIYDAEYKIEKEKALWSKGFETVYLVFKKDKELGVWQIVHYTTLTMEDEKQRGDCFCEFFMSDKQNFMTKTLLPSGKSYDSKLNNFVFTQEGEKNIVNVDGKTFEWRDKKEVYGRRISLNPNPKKPEPIEILGMADKIPDVIAVILRQGLYYKNCSNLKIRKKK